MAYRTVWEEKGVCWHLSGVVTEAEVFAFTNAFYENPKSDNSKYKIVDCEHVDRFELEDSTMEEIAALDYAASSRAVYEYLGLMPPVCQSVI